MKSPKANIDEQLNEPVINYQQLFEASKDGILIFNISTGKIIDANPFMTTILGYDKNYFIGKELWEIGLSKNKNESQLEFNNLKNNGYIRFSDMPLLTNNNKQIAVEFICNTYESNGHKIAQCNIRDITEYKKLNEQTLAKMEILTNSSRRKNEFLSLLGHELRNPIAPLSGALHILQLPNIPKETAAKMYIIMERQINSLVRILDNLLDIAHITTKKIDLNIEKAELHNIVNSAIQNSKALIDMEGHKLTVSLPTKQVWMEIDSARIIQVITNLLDNASKFTPKNGLISISAEYRNNDVVIRVKDNGIGIDSEILPYIFDMFTKVDSSITRAQGGMGIGLTLAKSIIELHNGSITAFSKGLGYGSEFTIWLPVIQPNRQDNNQ